MKFSQFVFLSALICIVLTGAAHSQEKSKKQKSDEKKVAQKAIKVEANLLILDADNKFVSDVKQDDVKIFEDGVEQKITLFAKKENAVSVGLVMDNTGSMRPQIERIRAAGLTFVSSLRPQDEAFLVRFVDSTKIETLQDWTADKKRIAVGLQDMYVEGGQSAIIDALYVSAEKMLAREKADKSKRCALVLITDGEDRDSYYKREQLFELLKGSNVQIFVIGLTGDLSNETNGYVGSKNPKASAEKLLNSMALQTDGAAFFMNSQNKKEFESALVSALKAILTELNSQFVIGYTSTNPKRDGLVRKLTVQVADGAKGEKRQTFIRESFIVPEEKDKK